MLAAIAVVRPTSSSLLVRRRSMVSLELLGQGEDRRRHLPAQTLHLPALGRGEWPGSPRRSCSSNSQWSAACSPKTRSTRATVWSSCT